MSSLIERVKRLEHDLRLGPDAISLHNDLPFAIFCYDPEQEWQLRNEMMRLKTRLENDHVRRVVPISLAELFWRAVDEAEGMDEIQELEVRSGFEKAQEQITDDLSQGGFRPLADVFAEKLRELNADHDYAFIWRAGVLSPNLYRVSKLLNEMKNKSRVPSVVFMPATSEGPTLRFTGIAENEARGSYPFKVYLD